MGESLLKVFHRAKSGDAEALEQFFALVKGRVLSFSRRICGDVDDAYDALQETLLSTFKSLPKLDFKDPKALNVWLYKVAVNACLMMRRKSKFEPEQELSLDEFLPSGQGEQKPLEIPDWSNIPEDRLLRDEIKALVRRATLALPTNYRQVLVLRDMEGLSTKEVADVLGISEQNVKIRLHRARLFMRKELERYFSPRAQQPEQRGDRRVEGIAPSCREMFERLSEYLDGELELDLCQHLESHLRDCAPCAAFLNTLRKTIELCRSYAADEKMTIPPEEKEKLRAALEACRQAILQDQTSP
ncbi:MAG: sigma-70 family RNA polymerase sigma factor [Blastocatellia bacterium]|nr:sigma-70 family RNA polymerase sigma factor [Blastocatellia bacterium]MCS7158213.1 sigma-70 family RNA polymerase sigma factor [Blastocatellia bacterium]MCX7753563.1 sigma-70 family RNA polymerase sigma factor [Blastocatellia bacterium]MDW8169367.1 sigma-70 family RNA polymerase sigma factor [Acidobacteriota bacterium]MDW8255661.1 sigma-70 family RNA polymerase sigma factor [Acidobacteriota bacterium]